MTEMGERLFATERWTWCGVHANGAKVWREPDGNECTFKKVRGGVVGGIYELKVWRGDNGDLSIKQDIVFTGDVADDAVQLELRSKTWAEERSSELLENRRKRDGSKVDAAMVPIKSIASKCVTHADRQALINMVTREIWQAKKTDYDARW